MPDTLELVDVEESLQNKHSHFRSVHTVCVQSIAAGSLFQSNCGELYRTGGRRIPWHHQNCQECISNVGKRPCPVCGGFDSPPLW